MNATMKVLFWIRKSRKNESDECPVMTRVTIRGDRKDFFSGINVAPSQWHEEKLRIRGKTDIVREKNLTLDNIEAKLRKIFNRLADELDDVTVYDVYASYSGKHRKVIFLQLLMADHNELYKRRTKTDRSLVTYNKYVITKERVTEFLEAEMGIGDLAVKAIKPTFIQDFYQFLLSHHDYHHNTAAKHVTNLKRFMNYAVERGYIEHNPFTGFRCSFKATEQVILTSAELERIRNKHFEIPRLQNAKNLFLLQCYTGLSFVDLASLRHNHLQEGAQGKRWIRYRRTKTEVPVSIPLLDQAYKILCELQPVHIEGSEDRLLPAISNQKMNAYLKEIGDLCGINKSLSTHVGRRTFATTVLLENGVAIEAISKMLGHTNIRTTQIYAKVKDVMVEREMDRVDRLLKN